MTGRPSSYNQKIADEIMERLATGESLRSICNDPNIPARTTIDRWRDSDAAFDAKCARAVERGIECEVDGMREIEDKTLSGEYDPAAARAVLSSMQWRASKRFAKRYGDKVSQEISGPDGAPVQHKIIIEMVDDKPSS